MKWEYLVLKKKIKGLAGGFTSPEAELNKFGEDGWELVAVNKFDNYETLFIFKRLKK